MRGSREGDGPARSSYFAPSGPDRSGKDGADGVLGGVGQTGIGKASPALGALVAVSAVAVFHRSQAGEGERKGKISAFQEDVGLGRSGIRAMNGDLAQANQIARAMVPGSASAPHAA